MKYEVCKKSIDKLGRSEWTCVKNTASKKEAVSYAKLSSVKAYYETEVRGFDDDGDVCFHAYYEKGKLKIDMAV